MNKKRLNWRRKWVHEFVHWYNEEHRHSSIRFITPGQRHRGEDHAILANRKVVYEGAKQSTPQRWSGAIRNWDPVTDVWLNPPKEIRAEDWNTLEAA